MLMVVKKFSGQGDMHDREEVLVVAGALSERVVRDEIYLRVTIVDCIQPLFVVMED